MPAPTLKRRRQISAFLSPVYAVQPVLRPDPQHAALKLTEGEYSKRMKSKSGPLRYVYPESLVLALENISQGQIYNFENDFSQTVSAGTSVWSYRWKDGFARDGNYLLRHILAPGHEAECRIFRSGGTQMECMLGSARITRGLQFTTLF